MQQGHNYLLGDLRGKEGCDTQICFDILGAKCCSNTSENGKIKTNHAQKKASAVAIVE